MKPPRFEQREACCQQQGFWLGKMGEAQQAMAAATHSYMADIAQEQFDLAARRNHEAYVEFRRLKKLDDEDAARQEEQEHNAQETKKSQESDTESFGQNGS